MPDGFWIWICVSIVSILVATFIVARNHRRTKRTMESLSEMLDSAIAGTFSESAYDETMLSSIESKMHRYIVSTKLLEDDLASEKDKIKTLISDISHQTKTPIANILLYMQLLGEQDDLPEACKNLAAQAETQVEKLRFLVDSLVKASRLETGIITVNPYVNAVDELLESVCSQAKPAAEEANIHISLEKSGLSACFDTKWTAEAVGNILDNAIKYSPQNSEITVSTVAYEFFCRIDIKDAGIGISEEELPLIFQRFFRSPAVAQKEGVGIGLYLSREIIEAQNGYIKVNSKSGKGALFSVFLPIEQKNNREEQ